MSQTFKSPINRSILFEFLEKICEKRDKYFVFDLSSYKRGELNNENELFLEIVKPYYHTAKQFYIERKLSYSRLCTIIRQICKFNSISFTTKVLYSKSKYNIPYYIYF